DAGFALEFNGKDSYVDLPTLRYDGSHPITLEATTTPHPLETRGHIVGDMFGGGVTLQAGADNRTGLTQFSFPYGDTRGNRSYSSIYTGVEVSPRFHVAGVRDNRSYHLFVNGKLLVSGLNRGEFQPAEGNFWIGAHALPRLPADRVFLGLI